MAKKQPVAGPPAARAWTAQETTLLRRRFATATNRDLAELLGRTAKSVIYRAASLGLSKSAAHRSKQSRRTALSAARSSEQMAALGSLGGLVGGPARAAALDEKRRSAIAKKAVSTRWENAKKTQTHPA